MRVSLKQGLPRKMSGSLRIRSCHAAPILASYRRRLRTPPLPLRRLDIRELHHVTQRDRLPLRDERVPRLVLTRLDRHHRARWSDDHKTRLGTLITVLLLSRTRNRLNGWSCRRLSKS